MENKNGTKNNNLIRESNQVSLKMLRYLWYRSIKISGKTEKQAELRIKSEKAYLKLKQLK
ncbi:MAG: hypothetical protein RBR63_05255 [Methanosarcina vacuolata]|nr:hypothetical protein [Methanosarcina vacuolata]